MNDDTALRLAVAFEKYKNATDILLFGSNTPRPHYQISADPPRKVGRGLVYTALPSPVIPTDSKNHEHHINRIQSVVVCTMSLNPERERVGHGEVFWLRELTDEEIEGKTVDDLWVMRYGTGLEESKKDTKLDEKDEVAVAAWSNVGSPSTAPTEPFVPSEEQRSRWKPIKTSRTIAVDWYFDQEMHNKLEYGHKAQQQEDKWNIYFENGTVHFHRSWTGNELFRFYLGEMVQMLRGDETKEQIEALQADKHYAMTSFEVEQDPESYKETDEQKIKDTLLQVLQVVLGVKPILARETKEAV